jgi:hypothetical protein
MSKFYFAKGIVRYREDGWVIIEAPYSVVNYYKWWVEKFIWKKTTTSYHKPHITVVAAKHAPAKNAANWKKYDGQVVEFKYYTTIYTDHKKQYFWLVVESPDIAKIRKSLGLPPELKWPYHLTICYCGY